MTFISWYIIGGIVGFLLMLWDARRLVDVRILHIILLLPICLLLGYYILCGYLITMVIWDWHKIKPFLNKMNFIIIPKQKK